VKQGAEALGKNNGSGDGEYKKAEAAQLDGGVPRMNGGEDIKERGNAQKGGANDNIAQGRSGEGCPKDFRQGGFYGGFPSGVYIMAEYIHNIVSKDINDLKGGEYPPYIKNVIPKRRGKYSLDNGKQQADCAAYPGKHSGFSKRQMFQKGCQQGQEHKNACVFEPEGNIGIRNNAVYCVASHQKINSHEHRKKTVIEVVAGFVPV
jgi:hypothetical protein